MRGMDYDPLAADYAEHRRAQPEILAALSRGLSAQSGVLEVGCGTGNYLLGVWRTTGASCWGVDPSAEMLAVARGRGLRVTAATAERLPFDDCAFDLVFSVDVIHHVRARPAAVREAFRVLRPGGGICVGTEDEEMIRTRLHAHYFPETVDVELARYPTVAELREWLAAAGFEAVEEERTETVVTVRDSRAHRAGAFSSMHLISREARRAGLERLDADVARGPIEWPARQLLVWARKR